MGAPRAKALCHSFSGALEFQTGSWSDAERELRKAIDLYRDVGSASGESLSRQRLGVLLTATGAIEEARRVLNEGLVIAERAAMRSHCLTRLHASMTRNRLAAGDLEGATTSLLEGLEAAARHGHCVTCNALLLPEAVRVRLANDDVDAAERHAGDLAHIARRFQSRAWRAMAAQARGRVLLARREGKPALEHLEEARLAFLDVDQAYEASRCRLAEAAAYELLGDEAAAGAARDDATAGFAILGASGGEP